MTAAQVESTERLEEAGGGWGEAGGGWESTGRGWRLGEAGESTGRGWGECWGRLGKIGGSTG